jgi:hypothetical protein
LQKRQSVDILNGLDHDAEFAFYLLDGQAGGIPMMVGSKE